MILSILEVSCPAPEVHACTVKSRQSAPTSSSLQVGRGGWASPTCHIQCNMKKYSPYENCPCISYTDQRSRARSRADPSKLRVCAIPRSLVKRVPRVDTVAYISNGVEHASAVQYSITDCDRVIRGYIPDKKSGRGG